MARKSTSTVADDDFDAVAEPRAPSRAYDDSPLDARILALDDEEESPFLRGQKRVPVRRGVVPRKAADRLKFILILLLVLGVVGFVGIALYRYGTQSWRFQVDSSDNLEIQGLRNVTRGQVLEVLGADIDRNVFFVPLAEQKKQLEAIPWVESATVMRFLPNRLRIQVRERVPVAFVNINGRIALVDPHGVVMDMPPGAQGSFSFPAIINMNDSEPLSTRAARMKIYNELMLQLDSTGAQYTHQISEVDVSDPDDVKVMVEDSNGTVLVHLGPNNFLPRFQLYVNHVQEWRTQFTHLSSVDLRFDGQVIVNPDEAAARARELALHPVTTDTTSQNAPPPAPKPAATTTRKKH